MKQMRKCKCSIIRVGNNSIGIGSVFVLNSRNTLQWVDLCMMYVCM